MKNNLNFRASVNGTPRPEPGDAEGVEGVPGLGMDW